MAVYTHLSAGELVGFIGAYDVGALISAKGIAEGVSNSNWLVETTGSDVAGTRFVLTIYEHRTDASDLPFFLGLLDHLADRGCAVPRTIHDRQGNGWREIRGKAAALIEFLPGLSPDQPSAAQAHAAGAELARIHLESRGFAQTRANDLGPQWAHRTLSQCGAQALAAIDDGLPPMVEAAREIAGKWPEGLPASIIHSDLFPDNVLMLGEKVSGMIDFYFACNGAMAYDLAVTHAAWCFDTGGEAFNSANSAGLLAGYESVRPLACEERAALPLLARGATIRFIASRAQDWIETPADALVTRKDPMDFVRRHRFYCENGISAFA